MRIMPSLRQVSLAAAAIAISDFATSRLVASNTNFALCVQSILQRQSASNSQTVADTSDTSHHWSALQGELPQSPAGRSGAALSGIGAVLALSLCAAGIRRKSLRSDRLAPRARLCAAKLHGSQRTRSPLVNWYCYEADIPLDMLDPLPSPHPFGQVPHLSDDGGVEVFESGAILLYLADKYGGLDSPEKRAKYTKWVVWANATLEEVCFGPRFSGAQIALPSKTMDRLEAILSQSEWLVDDEFSVADVAVGAYLNYVPVFFGDQNLSSRPNVAAYMKRCAARPAFVQAFGKEHADAVNTKIRG